MSVSDEKHETEKPAVDHIEVKDVASVEGGSDQDPGYVSPADNKRVVRKVDLNIMPVLCAIIAFMFLDKTALTYTSVMGIMLDVKMDNDSYAWLSSIFSLGVLIGQYPMCALQQRLPLAKFTGFCIIMWGLMVVFCSICHTWSQLMACRFFLGVFESAISPALMIITAQWYRKQEQGSRTGVWASFTTWGGVLGAGVAYALHTAGNKHKLTMRAWRVLFIFFGCSTIVIGIVFALVIPDSIRSAWFLNEEEKDIAERRTLENQETIGEKTFRKYQVKAAFTDPQVLIMCVVGFFNSIANGGITSFYGILVISLGIPVGHGILLSMLNCWVSVVTILALVYGARLHKRCLISAAPHLISMAGAIIVWQLPFKETKARLAGFYLCLVYAIAQTACMGLISSNVTGRTKKTTASAMFFIVQQVGNLIGPQTFKKPPRYAPALIILIICNIVTVILMVALHFYYTRENARRDKLALERPTEADAHLHLTVEDHIDLTDRENLHFRYAT